jgi:hypothetical protein
MFYGVYVDWPEFEMIRDKFYGIFLYLKHPFKRYINMNDIEKIKILEAKVFPQQMVAYKKITSKKAFLEKMMCATSAQIEYCVTDDMLFLCIHHYNSILIKDFGMITNDFRRVFEFCNKKIEEYTSQNKPVYLDAREITSYKILKFYEKKKRFKIVEDIDNEIGGEKFHRLKIVKYGA